MTFTHERCKDFLKQVGYPTDVLVLDAECYFDKDYSLKKLSIYEFVNSNRFELLGWAAKRNNSRTEFLTNLPKIDWNALTIVVHNAPFDATILAQRHNLYPPFIVDTLDLARHREPRWSNSLAALCERHKLPSKGDTLQFSGLHRQDFTGDQWVELIKYATNDAERTYDLLHILLPYLSNPKFELSVAAYTRGIFIRPVLGFNVHKAERLKKQMIEESQQVLKRVDQSEKEIRGNKSFELLMREELGSEEPPMKQGKKGPMLAIAKTDGGREYLLNHPNERIRALLEARIAVKSWPLHIKRIKNMECAAFAAKGKLPVPLKYYGAHSGRWSGAGGINLQNLPARSHELVNEIRSLIIAPVGHVLVIIDFSQIEARVLAWLADQNDLVQKFAEGRPIYCEFASEFTGHKIRKVKPSDSPTVKEWHSNFRSLGKVATLGAGYGMGAARCLEYAKTTYGVELTPREAERLIQLYRRQNHKIVAYWGKVERAFTMVTQYPNERFQLEHNITFSREHGTTIIQLPSGRRLYYHGARVTGNNDYAELVMPDPRTGTGKIHMWGGYLVENIVQAVSRDILAVAVLRIGELGLRVPLIVHDDMAIPVPKNKLKEFEPRLKTIAKQPIRWARGLPTDIDCHTSQEYSK